MVGGHMTKARLCQFGSMDSGYLVKAAGTQLTLLCSFHHNSEWPFKTSICIPPLMAGAFSGHLLASYDTQRSTPGPRFGQPQSSYSSIVTSGAMSFDASMHGSSGFRPSNSVSGHSFSTDLTDDTAIKIATLQAKLNKKLGPEYISQRPGPGGGPKLTYAEGWKIINLANEVFGFNGWSSSIVNMTIDYMDCNEEGKRYNVGVSCIVRVTLSCGVYHEDVGYGAAENVKSKAQAIDKVILLQPRFHSFIHLSLPE